MVFINGVETLYGDKELTELSLLRDSTLTIEGNVSVTKDLDLSDHSSLCVLGDLTMTNANIGKKSSIKVSGEVLINGNLDTTYKSSIECTGDIVIKGDATLRGSQVSAKNMDVTGSADIGTSTIECLGQGTFGCLIMFKSKATFGSVTSMTTVKMYFSDVESKELEAPLALRVSDTKLVCEAIDSGILEIVTSIVRLGSVKVAGDMLISDSKVDTKEDVRVTGDLTMEINSSLDAGSVIVDKLAKLLVANVHSIKANDVKLHGPTKVKGHVVATYVHIESESSIGGDLSATFIVSRSPIDVRGKVTAKESFKIYSEARFRSCLDVGGELVIMDNTYIDGDAHFGSVGLRSESSLDVGGCLLVDSNCSTLYNCLLHTGKGMTVNGCLDIQDETTLFCEGNLEVGDKLKMDGSNGKILGNATVKLFCVVETSVEILGLLTGERIEAMYNSVIQARSLDNEELIIGEETIKSPKKECLVKIKDEPKKLGDITIHKEGKLIINGDTIFLVTVRELKIIDLLMGNTSSIHGQGTIDSLSEHAKKALSMNPLEFTFKIKKEK